LTTVSVVLFIIGIVLAALGLAISIALHEVGHLVPAKLFGLRVPQYMIGFGPTIWSKRYGETEYGFKALPFGGYVSMIGMYPPKHEGEAPRAGGTGFISGVIDDARQASAEQVRVGEEHRTFYSLPVWKRLVIMLGGPFMNFVIAIVCFLIVVCGFGLYGPSTTVQSVSTCVVPQTQQADANAAQECATPAPAYAAGILPGDQLVSVDGRPMTSWADFSSVVRGSAGVPLTAVVERDGAPLTLTVTPQANTVYRIDPDTGQRVKNADGTEATEVVGFVGITPSQTRQAGSPAQAFEFAGQNVASVVNVIATMPQRVVQMWNAGFGGAERDPNGPMSVVGVGRITGEVAAQETIPIVDRLAFVVQIVGSVNIALGVMNLVPLPPLDGGHVAAALWDGIRRGWAKLLRRPAPRPFDTAKLVPVTLTVAVALTAISALFIFVDLVNPVKIF